MGGIEGEDALPSVSGRVVFFLTPSAVLLDIEEERVKSLKNSHCNSLI